METKPVIQKLSKVLTVIAIIFLGLIVVSWFVDYPKWLELVMQKILLISLGLIMLYKAYQIRSSDRKFARIYLIIAIILFIVTFISLVYLQIILVVGLTLFLLTDRRVKKILNKQE